MIAIGSPLGLEGTVTTGIVSALGRAVHVFDGSGDSDAYLDAIQTDAAINPGNSGGALVDAAGAVIGINSAAATNSSGGSTQLASGIGYAIPINYARDIATQLIKDGKAEHGSLGAQGRTAQAGLAGGRLPRAGASRAGRRTRPASSTATSSSRPTTGRSSATTSSSWSSRSTSRATRSRSATSTEREKKTTTVTLGSA